MAEIELLSIHARLTQLVECQLPKLNVASSSLVTRSNLKHLRLAADSALVATLLRNLQRRCFRMLQTKSDVDDISGVIKIGVFVVLRRIDKKRVVIKVLQRIITCIV